MSNPAYSGGQGFDTYQQEAAERAAVKATKDAIDAPLFDLSTVAQLVPRHFAPALQICGHYAAPYHTSLFARTVQLKSRTPRNDYLRDMSKALSAPDRPIAPSPTIDQQCFLALDEIIDWSSAPLRVRACFLAITLVNHSRNQGRHL